MDNKINSSRRSFLCRAGPIFIGGKSLLTFSTLSLAGDTIDKTIVSDVLQILFPHDLPEQRYQYYSEQLLSRAAKVPANVQLLVDGFSDLEKRAGKAGWLAIPENKRQLILKDIEASPFFRFVRHNGLEIIYRDEQVWPVVGYGGNALEEGGYLHNSDFGRVDWIQD